MVSDVFPVFCSLSCGSGIACGNGFWNRYRHHAALTNFIREISGAACYGDSSLCSPGQEIPCPKLHTVLLLNPQTQLFQLGLVDNAKLCHSSRLLPS